MTAAPIPNEFVAVLPSEQEIDAAEQATLADKVGFEGEEARLQCEFVLHLAPQIVLPSRMGRWQFVLGAGFVGMCNLASAWRNKGLRNSVLSHTATDACGVVAAGFRLGMDVGDSGA